MNGEDVVFEEVVWKGDRCTGRESQFLPCQLGRFLALNHGILCMVQSIELLGSGGWPNKSGHMRAPEGPSSLKDIRDRHVREHLESYSDSYFTGKISREIVYEETLAWPTVRENQGHGT